MYKLRTKITLFAEIGNHAAIIISLCDALARHKKRVPDTLAGHSVVSRRIRYFTSSNIITIVYQFITLCLVQIWPFYNQSIILWGVLYAQ